jgi:hypothetical protein
MFQANREIRPRGTQIYIVEIWSDFIIEAHSVMVLESCFHNGNQRFYIFFAGYMAMAGKCGGVIRESVQSFNHFNAPDIFTTYILGACVALIPVNPGFVI